MLEHLVSPDLEPRVCATEPEGFVRLRPTTSTVAIMEAQHTTADWLDSIGLSEAKVLPDVEREAARRAFSAIVVNPQDDPVVQEYLLELKIPEQVRQVTGMLTAYDWEFVAQAKEIRSYVVNRLVIESREATKAGDRIKALTALGKVTEVGLFTDKVEVKQTVQTDEELDARIKERIDRLRKVQDALAAPTSVSDVQANPG